MKKMNRAVGAVALAAASAMALSACGGSDGGGKADGQIEYWLWDANQLPAYQQCAADFNEANPDITVKVTQMGWGDYWSKLTNDMAANKAPDVFTNHVTKYPDYLDTNQLLAIDDSNIDLTQYADGLADLWVGQDGKRYGLPKDWDTIALFYNKDMAEAAGVTDEELQNLDWNPQDGGSYEDVIARLTVDVNGVHGNEDGFDKNNVETYGLGLAGSGGSLGQTEWSYFAATNGDWTHTDKNPWASAYNYGDESFQESIAWWKGLIDKGYMQPFETTVGASVQDTFAAKKSAMNSDGSWLIGQYLGYDDINIGLAPTPVGPNGKRASMFNGLADSIWAGTKNPEAAVKWVNYLASADCQDVVGEAGVVFPAIKTSVEKAVNAYAEKGLDVSPFTMQVDEGTTFLAPIAENAAKVDAIVKPAMDAIMAGQADVDSLVGVNEQVNALFK